MKKINFLLIILICVFSPLFANAQILTIPFGGPIIAIDECTCSGGLLVWVYDYKSFLPLPILFQPGISRLNQYYNFFTPGVMTVGTFTPGAVCTAGKTSCVPLPVAGVVTPFPFSGVGTGAIPAILGN